VFRHRGDREPQVSPEDVKAMMLMLMQINETLQRIEGLLLDEDGEEEEEPDT
jgi:hypothetical protein